MAGPAVTALAQSLCATERKNISDATAERAADCVLDALGAAAAGRHMQSTQAMQAVMTARAAQGRSSIWFGGIHCDPVSAAVTNAMAATALDIDDGHRKAAGHPGAAVVAAALAIAEDRDASMEDLLTATIVGYEASVRAALARHPQHHTSTVSGRWSGVGAAAAAAWLLDLPPDIMAQSLLIAEQHAPRAASALHHGFAGSDVKEAIAWSVQTGLYAVDLARNGFTGYPDTFDQDVLYDPDILCHDLERFDAIDGLFFKPYACCRWIHAAIDGLLKIIEENDVEPGSISSVAVCTFDRAVGLGNNVAPDSEAQAQFSIPFSLGAIAIHGRSALTPMNPRLLKDPAIREFANKVSVLPDASMNAEFPTKAPAVVKVEVAGAFFRSHVDAAFGDPTNPMSRHDLQNKFGHLTRNCLSRHRAGGIIAGLANAGTGTWVREALRDVPGICARIS